MSSKNQEQDLRQTSPVGSAQSRWAAGRGMGEWREEYISCVHFELSWDRSPLQGVLLGGRVLVLSWEKNQSGHDSGRGQLEEGRQRGAVEWDGDSSERTHQKYRWEDTQC